MTSKALRKTKSKCLVATLVTENRAPCVFCQRLADDELIYGKLYAIGDIQCHYFCVLLSCCLIQKGKDEEGLFGFLYADIQAEVERSKKHRCSFCGKGGATLGCSVSQCRKQFHLPCGRERNAVSLFYGNYKSFCELHAPKQKIPDHIMANARIRIKQAKRRSSLQDPKAPQKLSCLKELNESPAKPDTAIDVSAVESVCVICYEAVEGFPTSRTFWPPCCARDAWFHRTCLQRMALSAGMHYLKCPLCNDKENFYDAIVSQGYYVPDRDAAWELEQNAFAEIYERPLVCSADECLCPSGRDHDAETGDWDIKLCLLCGTSGAHARCEPHAAAGRLVCAACAPAAPAPADLHALHARLEAVILAEQAQSAQNETRRPVMPSRMSLRRTKQRLGDNAPSTSRASRNPVKTDINEQAQKTDTESSRLELNLKMPKRQSQSQNPPQKPIFEANVLKDIENKLLSPLKLVEQGLHERIRCLGVKEIQIDSNKVIERVRQKLKKPRPLCAKKRIVNHILESLFNTVVKNNPKTREAVKEWSSPKKTVDSSESSQENKAPTDTVNLFEDLKIAKQNPKRSRLSLKVRSPIKFKICTILSKEKNQQEVKDSSEEIEKNLQKVIDEGSCEEIEKNQNISMDKESSEEIDKVPNKEDKTPSNRDSIKKASETPTTPKICSKAMNQLKVMDEDSTEEIDKVLTNEDIKEANKNNTTPIKTENDTDVFNSNDSITKTLENDVESVNSKPQKEDKIKEISDKKDCNDTQTLRINDHFSINTFVLPAVFVAEGNSDESLPLFETPKTLKTVDIQKDSSLEICENDEVVNINHIRMQQNAEKSEFLRNLNLRSPVKNKKCAYKFSAEDKETLEEENVNIDLESFKNYYLNEVDREFKCNFGHKHKIKEEIDIKTPTKLRTVIDYALEAYKRENKNENETSLKRKSSTKEMPQNNDNIKRKACETEEVPKKKKKKNQHKMQTPKIKLMYNSKPKQKRNARKNMKNNSSVQNKNSDTNIQVVCASNTDSEEQNVTNTIDLTIKSGPERKNKTTKKKKHKKILKQNIQVKIRFKKEQVRLKITKSQRDKPKNKNRQKLLQQYVLKYCTDKEHTVDPPKTVIVKPEHTVTPMKRKYNLKQEKSPDNLVQTSIQSFFKVKPSQ